MRFPSFSNTCLHSSIEAPNQSFSSYLLHSISSEPRNGGHLPVIVDENDAAISWFSTHRCRGGFWLLLFTSDNELGGRRCSAPAKSVTPLFGSVRRCQFTPLCCSPLESPPSSCGSLDGHENTTQLVDFPVAETRGEARLRLLGSCRPVESAAARPRIAPPRTLLLGAQPSLFSIEISGWSPCLIY